jgi:4-alpha-glucanotransferase
VREMMAQHRMLSYRLFYFESDAPREYPEMALSTVTTHDLPTIAGLWTGADGKRSREAGVQQNEEGLRTLRGKMAALVNEDAAPAEVIERTYAALAQAPSRVLLATLDDALAVEDRPNLPGAEPDWPNWSMALPVPLDDFEGLPLPGKIARVLGER